MHIFIYVYIFFVDFFVDTDEFTVLLFGFKISCLYELYMYIYTTYIYIYVHGS